MLRLLAPQTPQVVFVALRAREEAQAGLGEKLSASYQCCVTEWQPAVVCECMAVHGTEQAFLSFVEASPVV